MLQRQEGSSSGALNSVSKIRNCCLFTNFYPVWSGGRCLHISQISNHYWHSLLCLPLLMHANTSQNERSNCSNQPLCETLSIVLSYPLAACPGCCREENLPSFQTAVSSLQSVPSSQWGRWIPILKNSNFVSTASQGTYSAVSPSPRSSMGGQKVMLILLLDSKIPQPCPFCQSDKSFFHKAKRHKSCEDIVPKNQKGFPFSSYLSKILFRPNVPGVIVVLKASPLWFILDPICCLCPCYEDCAHLWSQILLIFSYFLLLKALGVIIAIAVLTKGHSSDFYPMWVSW